MKIQDGYPVRIDIAEEDGLCITSSPSIPGLLVEDSNRHMAIIRFMNEAKTIMERVGHKELSFTFSRILG